jgi:hypothetical protein
MFIFDEIDKIPLTLLDIVKSYIDVDPYASGYDPTKSVFIFIRYWMGDFLFYINFVEFRVFV